MIMKSKSPIINILTERSKDILEECYNSGIDFAPVAFVIKDGFIVDAMSFSSADDERLDGYRSVGTFCSEMDCTEVVTVIDSYVREAPDEETDKYITDNWETERPRMYPESMRQDCLLLNHIDFGGEGKAQLGYIKYSTKNGKLEIGGTKLDKPDKGGDILRQISIGFMMAEAGKMPGTMDDNIGKVKDRYPMLKEIQK
jgi:hypothetical protein